MYFLSDAGATLRPAIASNLQDLSSLARPGPTIYTVSSLSDVAMTACVVTQDKSNISTWIETSTHILRGAWKPLKTHCQTVTIF